jgi:c-di-GMP-binding flagellar brake protein YcgR
VAVALERSRVFEAGLVATLELNGLEEALPTRIEEVRADLLVVATPMKQREYLRLGQGTKVMLSVSRRNSPYFFETTVVGGEHAQGQQVTLLRRPPDNAGITLRSQVRVAVAIADAQFWWEMPNGKFGPTVHGALVDLSAGGFQVVTRGGLPPETRLLARFTLGQASGHLMVDALVLRDYDRTSDLGVTSHRAHLKFVDLGEKERDRLIRFIFQRERELRQKGVL